MDDGGTDETKQQEQGIEREVQDRIERLRDFAGDAGQWIREFARERPVAAIAIAVGAGFLAGRLLSRA